MDNTKWMRWLEAAYLYYLHPEHGETVPDSIWDKWSQELTGSNQSLHWMKEEDYPLVIRRKYGQG